MEGKYNALGQTQVRFVDDESEILVSYWVLSASATLVVSFKYSKFP